MIVSLLVLPPQTSISYETQRGGRGSFRSAAFAAFSFSFLLPSTPRSGAAQVVTTALVKNFRAALVVTSIASLRAVSLPFASTHLPVAARCRPLIAMAAKDSFRNPHNLPVKTCEQCNRPFTWRKKACTTEMPNLRSSLALIDV